jgi:hypothetical protein
MGVDTEVQNEAADLIWHYTDGRGLQSILENRVLWASSASFMNDFNELLSGSRLLADLFDREKKALDEPVRSDLERIIRFPSYSYSRAGKFILSGSERGDSLTMWRAYGREEISYSIGLDRSFALCPRTQRPGELHPFPPPGYYDEEYEYDEEGYRVSISGDPDSDFVDGGTWTAVVYDQTKQQQIISETFTKLREGVEKKRRAAASGKSGSNLHLFELFFHDQLHQIKDAGFEDEREQRVLMSVNPEWKYVRHRPSRFGYVPYLELGLPIENFEDPITASPQEMDQLPIRRINIGPTPYREEAKGSLLHLLELLGYHDVEVIVSEIPFR